MASMTKEELKNALINHGAPVPPTSAKKEEFLQAYEEHIGPLEEGAGDFSSDNEPNTPQKKTSNASRRSNTGSASKLSTSSSASKLSSSSRKSSGSPKKSPKVIVQETQDIEMTVDISSLDDDQLFEMLKKNGLDVGPIVGSTRKIYEKKLGLALTGTTFNTNGNGFSDTEPEDDEEDEEDEQPAVQVVARKRIPRTSKAASSPLSESGLRQRLTLNDELDSSSGSGILSPRRGIHSYKVTETTRQVTTRARDGTEIVDTKHSVEKTETSGGGEKKSVISGLLYPLLKLVIVFILLAGLYVAFTTPSDGVTPIDKVIETINSALPPSESPVEEIVFEKPAVTEVPPHKPVRQPLPEAGNVVDV